MALRFITATRASLDDFRQTSPLVKSLLRVSRYAAIELNVSADNRAPLADVYNRAIGEAEPEDTLVFIHDDVWIDDWMIASRLTEALARYQVVGVAGNRRREPRQESWCLLSDAHCHDLEYLSGAISHGRPEKSEINFFGAAPVEVKLLDGVFLAVTAGTLQTAGIRFDPAFGFHFYDTDFCRSCEQAGLRMGTWPIALTHESKGVIATPEWNAAFSTYLIKWNEETLSAGK